MTKTTTKLNGIETTVYTVVYKIWHKGIVMWTFDIETEDKMIMENVIKFHQKETAQAYLNKILEKGLRSIWEVNN